MSRAAPAAAALLALLVRLGTGAHPVDDAYITFRYARNLGQGLGLIYNPGETVLGTTTPMWATVLGALYALGATDLPRVALLLSAAADGGTAALLAMAARRIGFSPAGAMVVGAAWAVNPMSVAYAAGGMETSAWVLLIVASLLLVANGRTRVAALLGGVGTMLRPEAALLAITVVLWRWRTTRRVPLAEMLLAAVPALAWAAAAWAIYGSAIPHSVLAKQVAYRGASPLVTVVAFVYQAGLPGWSPFFGAAFPSILFSLPLALGGCVVLGVWARQGVPWLRGSGITWEPFAVFGGLLVAFYVLGGLRGGRLFPWYLVPMAALYLLLGASGVRALAPRAASALVALPLLLWQVPSVDWTRPFLPIGFDLRREALYADVGRSLRDLAPGTVVAAPEIGALGYLLPQAVILDTVGLVSPAALRYYPLPPEQLVDDNAIPAGLILERRPDVVVTLDQFARQSIGRDAEFERVYRLDQSLPAPIWQSRELWIFRRR